MKEIQLSRGMVAIVDDGDHSRLSDRPWYAVERKHTCYAADRDGNLMHRVLMRAQPGQEVDHRDANGLNNQRDNLRLCTPTQNRRNLSKRRTNKSGFKGVHWYRQTAMWRVQCQHKHVGTFARVEEAARAYDTAATAAFGEYAKLNFPKGKNRLPSAA